MPLVRPRRSNPNRDWLTAQSLTHDRDQSVALSSPISPWKRAKYRVVKDPAVTARLTASMSNSSRHSLAIQEPIENRKKKALAKVFDSFDIDPTALTLKSIQAPPKPNQRDHDSDCDTESWLGSAASSISQESNVHHQLSTHPPALILNPNPNPPAMILNPVDRNTRIHPIRRA